MRAEDLEKLKEQPEWAAVINYFANDVYALQDAMIADLTDERRKFLAAKAQMASKYLDFALDGFEDEEG